MSQKITVMQEYLMKVLSTMKMRDEIKVLIALELITDEQIYKFLKWLKENMPEEKVEQSEREILRQVSSIIKGNKI